MTSLSYAEFFAPRSGQALIEAAEELTVPFKRFRGLTALEVIESDPGYMNWARHNTDWGVENAPLIDACFRLNQLRAVEALGDLSLTEHQSEQVNRLIARVQEGARIIFLNGGAGYGKSFTTLGLGAELIRMGYTLRGMAVSRVATDVLMEQMDKLNAEAGTVAATLKFAKQRDPETGKNEYVHTADTPEAAAGLLAEGHALIVDECSMINDRDAQVLFEAVTSREEAGLLILVGDAYQLPPVKQDTLSMCCTALQDEDIATLSVPMRYQADSPLATVEQIARNAPHQASRDTIFSLGYKEAVRRSNSRELLEDYVEAYRREPLAVHRMFFYRTERVAKANTAVRTALYGYNAGDLAEDGEPLMIMATSDVYGGGLDTVRFYSGKTVRVESFEESYYDIIIAGEEFHIPCYTAELMNRKGSFRLMFSPKEGRADETKRGGVEYNAAMNAAFAWGRAKDENDRRIGSWEPKRELEEAFLPVGYCYATTVHRAQGQTVDYAYCQPSELLAIQPPIMGRALTYVAMTRARKRLTVLV